MRKYPFSLLVKNFSRVIVSMVLIMVVSQVAMAAKTKKPETKPQTTAPTDPIKQPQNTVPDDPVKLSKKEVGRGSTITVIVPNAPSDSDATCNIGGIEAQCTRLDSTKSFLLTIPADVSLGGQNIEIKFSKYPNPFVARIRVVPAENAPLKVESLGKRGQACFVALISV